MLIDTHAHIEEDEIVENDNLIIIASGVDQKSNEKVIELIKRHKNIYGTIGIHPEYADIYREEDIDYIINNIDNPKIVGIGEIGLDYHYENYNKEKQTELFLRLLKIANDYKKTAVIHTRDSIEDMYQLLKDHLDGNKAVLHCYGGSLEMANKFINMGIKLGIGGVLTFKNGVKLKEIVEALDICNFVLETDAPYLAPEPIRGTKNVSSNVKYVAMKMAELKNMGANEVENITTQNAIKLFDLPLPIC